MHHRATDAEHRDMTPPTPTVTSEQLYEELWAHVQPESSRRLLICALDCFATKGFEGASTREIAERAGMSPAGLYVHYRSKNEILFEISRTGHQRNYEDSAAAVGVAEGPTRKLFAFVESFVIWHARFHTLARVSQYELKSLEPEHLEIVRKIRRRFQHELEKILGSGVECGEFAVDEQHGTARAILSLGIDVARWFTNPGPLQPEELGELYADLALRMVRQSER